MIPKLIYAIIKNIAFNGYKVLVKIRDGVLISVFKSGESLNIEYADIVNYINSGYIDRILIYRGNRPIHEIYFRTYD